MSQCIFGTRCAATTAATYRRKLIMHSTRFGPVGNQRDHPPRWDFLFASRGAQLDVVRPENRDRQGHNHRAQNEPDEPEDLDSSEE